MDEQRLIERAARIPCAGVLLWGSRAKGDATARSDIDICLVAGPGQDPADVQRAGWQTYGDAPDIDVKVFEDLPIYLQGEIFQAHRVLATSDEPALYEYLRPYWKRWNDQAHRHRLTDEEARDLFVR